VEVAHEYGLRAVNYAYLFFTDEKALELTAKLVEFRQAKEEDQNLPAHLKRVEVERIEAEIERGYRLAGRNGVWVSFYPPLKGEEIRRYFFEEDFSYATKCFLPWYSSRINPYGDVYPCSIDVRIGNVRRTKFSELWNSKAYIDFRKRLKENKLFPKCRKCCNLTTKLWNYLPSL